MTERNNKRVAVTGATGMIGGNLVAELIKAGYTDIVVPIRTQSRIAALERTLGFHGLSLATSPVEVIESPLTDTPELAWALDGVDTLFNCAGTIMTGELTEQQLIENNILIARSVVDASLKAGVGKVIHTSSIVILDSSGDHRISPLNEESVAPVTSAGSAYAQSKYRSDLEIRRGEHEGLQAVIVLPAVVIGEGDWSLDGSSAMIPLISRGLPVYADGVMAYVDARDVGRAMIALDNCPGATGQTFVLAGGNLSYRELITAGAKAAGKRQPFIRVGKAALETGYGAIKCLSALGLMRDRSIKRDNLNSVLYGNRYDGSKIEKFCNFAYSPLEETITRVVTNYLSEKRVAKAGYP